MSEEQEINHQDSKAVFIDSMYQSWFLDYASYVILERAVPALFDGLKPVQRRILHAMKEMDDGRFNKVANVIGQTMQYHPHGDASIGDAIVNIGQKDLLIDTQGNWGDVRTGDSAAAPRYIEARLSKFANEVAFNGKTTEWQLSYDGRKNEPVLLPMKFPLLLAQGAEGIAVGLSTKILPHNFIELIDAAVRYLKGRKFELYPDFLTGGMMDVSNYNDGMRGGKVRVRAHIEKVDAKTLHIKNVPFGITTLGLAESILKANDSGKIKIKSVRDNTAAEVELDVQLAPGISPDQTIDALYLFTDCEVSISPNACVISDDKPEFLGVSELLRRSVDYSKALLLKELEIKLAEQENDWHFSSLEKIFIENRIYRDIEEEQTWEGVLAAIDKGLEPFKKLLRRIVTEEDIIRLTEIKIKRISKFDSFKADEHIKTVEETMAQIRHDMVHLTDFTIKYFENLQKKYGKGRERKTEIRPFETIQATTVAIANTKLYVNRKEGFVGTSLKKDEYAFDCSNLDLIIVFLKDGRMMVTKVADKTFVGKDIIHVDVFKKNDERTTYNMIYVDGKSGIALAKRFNVTGITRDKEYNLTKGAPGSKVIYFTANPNAEAEVVSVHLNSGASARIKELSFSFAKLEIKGRSAGGNQVTKYPIRTVKLKEKGVSTLAAPKFFFDEEIGKLNQDGYGKLIGRCAEEDRIIAFYSDGTYELSLADMNKRFEVDKLKLIAKHDSEAIYSLIYFDKKQAHFFAKRFHIETQTLNNHFLAIREGDGNYLELATQQAAPIVELDFGKKYEKQELALAEAVDVTGWKAVGTKIADADLKKAILISEELTSDEPDIDVDIAPTLF
ncbi:MAG: DNA gyrase/topoisomerase IV subunit A [Bacteroidetes bacterium]|nr:DNA gyrase/topoisomerase IV subunit A [Bacteroidota bacterium]